METPRVKKENNGDYKQLKPKEAQQHGTPSLHSQTIITRVLHKIY